MSATAHSQHRQFFKAFEERHADAKRALEGPRPRDVETYLKKILTQIGELKELVDEWSLLRLKTSN